MSFTAVIDANIRGLEKGVDAAQAKIDSLELGVNKKLKTLGDSFTDLGKKASIFSIAFAGAVGLSVKAAIDFESAFAGVEKTVDGTADQMATLSQGIRDMAKEIPASTTEIAAVAEAAGQLGIQTDNILEFTRVMIDLGEASNLSADQAATALARLANIMQTPQTEFDRLGSTIASLGNTLATTESEIVEMGLRLAGAGKQVGLTEAQVLSLAGALSSVGIEAQAGGSSLSRMMIDMQLAVETGSEDLMNFARVAGMTADQFAKSFRDDAGGAIISFIEGLARSEEQGKSAIAVLDEMGITEIRLRDALLRAAGASSIFSASMEQGTAAWEGNTALADEAARRYATTESQIRILRNTMVDLGMTIGDMLLPHVNRIVSGLRDFIERLTNLDPAIQKIILVIGGMAAAVGPLLLTIGSILKVLPLLGAAFTALTGPVGIAVAAIAAAVALIIANWDNIKAYFTTGGGAGMFNAVRDLAIALRDNLRNTFETIRAAITAIWDRVGTYITGKWKATFDSVKAVIDFFMGTVTNLANFLTAIINRDFNGALNALRDQFANIFNAIMRIATNALSSVSNSIAGFLDAIGLDGWASSVKGFADKMAAAFTPVKSVIDSTVGSIQEEVAATNEASVASTGLAGTLDGLTESLSGVNNGAASAVSTFEKLIGTDLSLRESIDKTASTIEDLQSKLIKLQTGILTPANVLQEIEDTNKQIKDLSDALDALTGDRELNIKVKVQKVGVEAEESDFFKDGGLVVPAIDTSLVEDSMGKFQDLTGELQQLADEFNNTIADSISSGIESIVTGLTSVDGLDGKAVVAAVLTPLGDLATRLGQIAIATGIGIEGIKQALSTLNPVAAIAAGVALVALGSAVKGAVSNLTRRTAGGGGYTGGTTSYNNVSTPGASEYRGMYHDDFTVTFVQKGGDLVAVLDTAEQRRRRT